MNRRWGVVFTCPQAMKMAATMFAAWALKPPILPAIAEPTRFLLMFRSTRAAVLLFSICTTMKRLSSRKNRFESICLNLAATMQPVERLYLLHHPPRHRGLTHNRLPSAQNPVDCSGLLVSAVVTTERQHLQVRKLQLESVQSLLRPLQETTHKHQMRQPSRTGRVFNNLFRKTSRMCRKIIFISLSWSRGIFSWVSSDHLYETF